MVAFQNGRVSGLPPNLHSHLHSVATREGGGWAARRSWMTRDGGVAEVERAVMRHSCLMCVGAMDLMTSPVAAQRSKLGLHWRPLVIHAPRDLVPDDR